MCGRYQDQASLRTRPIATSARTASSAASLKQPMCICICRQLLCEAAPPIDTGWLRTCICSPEKLIVLASPRLSVSHLTEQPSVPSDTFSVANVAGTLTHRCNCH